MTSSPARSESIERQLDTLVEQARPKPGRLGTVRVDPSLEIPRYVDAVDIHAMPGNFHTELGADDVFAGALYDRGVHVFAFGGLGARNDDGMGQAAAAFFKVDPAQMSVLFESFISKERTDRPTSHRP